eukprot:TRINITY_DN13914_c0_g1_i1.p1 TRINITY_DN13914_c0_g1~~TRINITY_DN13914_c0_g1_i1.p1  ORF type:complete len:329 (+),score=73.68 TRINITY_DN13914_c0_g1_i1:102-1088(+)
MNEIINNETNNETNKNDIETVNCHICDCKKFEPNIFDSKYCKTCYHKMEKHKKSYMVERPKTKPFVIKMPQQTNNFVKLKKTPNNNSPPNKNHRVTLSQPLEPKGTDVDIKLDQSLDLAILKKNKEREERDKLTVSLDMSNLTKKVDRKTLLVMEIIATESDYVKSISYLLKNYLSVLENTITTNDINLIFSNIIWIFNINSEFESELKEFQRNQGDMSEMFDILSKYSELFKAYGTYGSSYDDALIHLALLKKDNQNFAKTLTEIEKSDGKKWNLETYLITPIQRICRYPLLLRELISCTDTEDPNYKILLETHKKNRENSQNSERI